MALLGSACSEPLRRRALFWATRLSFGNTALLVEQMAGRRLFSEDGVWRLVQAEAQALDDLQAQAVQAEPACAAPALAEPEYAAPADLYSADACEFVAMTDGIGVKAQKPTRERGGGARTQKAEKRHDTDVLLLPRRGGGEQILCEGVSGRWSLVEAARAFLRREWGGDRCPVVALTDGAKTIPGGSCGSVRRRGAGGAGLRTSPERVYTAAVDGGSLDAGAGGLEDVGSHVAVAGQRRGGPRVFV